MRHLLVPLLLLPTAALAQTGGPDDGGYWYAPTDFDWVDLESVGDELTLEPAESATLPWAFPFYGVDYTEVSVNVYGTLEFGTPAVSAANGCLPDATAAPDVAVLWQDASWGSGEAFTWYDATDDRFIVSWQGVTMESNNVSFQAQLFPSGRIEFHYDDVTGPAFVNNNGAAAVVGIQDFVGGSTGALQRSCREAVIEADTAIGFEVCVDADGDGDPSDACGGGDCDDADDTIASTLPEVCDGLDTDCDGAIGAVETVGTTDGDFDATDRIRGNRLQATSTGVLTGVDAFLSTSTDAELTYLVYEATSATGTYTQIASATALPGATGASWHASGLPDVPVVSGRWYMVVVHFTEDDVTYYYESGPSWPEVISWAEVETGVRVDDIPAAPATLDGATASVTSWEYRWRYTFDDEGDGDGDGVLACDGDCDDTDATISPNATEVCDGLDTDCDGALPADEEDADGDGVALCDGDCDDADADLYPGAPELCDGLDNDCDGVVPADEVDADGDLELECQDCDDTDAAIFSGADEVCDGLDNNCDTLDPGLIADEVEPNGDTTGGDRARGNIWQVDDSVLLDGWDAFLTVAPGTQLTWQIFDSDTAGGTYLPVTSWTTTTTESGDAWHSSGSNPTTLEPGRFYALMVGWTTGLTYHWNQFGEPLPVDFGFGSLVEGMTVGEAAPTELDGGTHGINVAYAQRLYASDEADEDADGSFLCSGDCDDDDPANFPGNPEICDGQDNDCDPTTDDNADEDADGLSPCDGDCDDTNADTYPEAVELCDGVDNDCDDVLPADEADDDADGFRVCDGDCDDADAGRNPDASEACNGLDDDCDGAIPDDEVDADGDTWAPCSGDCDDAADTTFPGAPELCDGLDNDCDDTVEDESADEDGDGVANCDGDCDDADADVYPGAPELCDGVDQDCDGEVPSDEVDGDGDGTVPCDGDCDDSDAAVGPDQEEVCDGLDTDCNGALPDDEADADGDQALPCAGDCDDSDAALAPSNPEDTVPLCRDGLDNDCDGAVDAADGDCPEDPSAGGLTSGGCSCSAGDSDTSSAWLVLPLLLLTRRRRAA